MNYAYIKRASNYPGIDNLNPSLTINGTAVNPTFRYKLGDANATNLVPWGYGETLTRVAVATPPTYNNGSPGLGDNDDSCKFNGSDYYQYSTDADFADLTTEDLVVEVVWKSHVAGSNTRIIAKKNVDNEGWEVQDRTDNKLCLIIEDAATNNFSLYSAAVTAGTWNHALFFVNRSEDSTNGASVFVNGLSSDTGNPFAAAATITTTEKFTVGARTGGGNPHDGAVAYIAAWEYADWHKAGADGPAEWATIAAERFASLKAGWDWDSLA